MEAKNTGKRIEQELLLNVYSKFCTKLLAVKNKISPQNREGNLLFYTADGEDKKFLPSWMFEDVVQKLPKQIEALAYAGAIPYSEVEKVLQAIRTWEESYKKEVGTGKQITYTGVELEEFKKAYEIALSPIMHLEKILKAIDDKIQELHPENKEFLDRISVFQKKALRLIEDQKRSMQDSWEKFEKNVEEWEGNKIKQHILDKDNAVKSEDIYSIAMPENICLDCNKRLSASIKYFYKETKEMFQELNSILNEFEILEAKWEDKKEFLVYFFMKEIKDDLKDFKDICVHYFEGDAATAKEMKDKMYDSMFAIQSFSQESIDSFFNLIKELDVLLPYVKNEKITEAFANVESVYKVLPEIFLNEFYTNKEDFANFIHNRMSTDEASAYVYKLFHAVVEGMNRRYGEFLKASLTIKNTGKNSLGQSAGSTNIDGEEIKVVLNVDTIKDPVVCVLTMMHEFVHALQLATQRFLNVNYEKVDVTLKQKVNNFVRRSALLPLSEKWLQAMIYNYGNLPKDFSKTQEFLQKHMFVLSNAGSSKEDSLESLKNEIAFINSSNEEKKRFFEYFYNQVYYARPMETQAYVYGDMYADMLFWYLEQQKIFPSIVVKSISQMYDQNQRTKMDDIYKKMEFINTYLEAQVEDFKNTSFERIVEITRNALWSEDVKMRKFAYAFLTSMLPMYHATHAPEFHGFEIMNEVLSSPYIFEIVGEPKDYLGEEKREEAKIDSLINFMNQVCFLSPRSMYKSKDLSAVYVEENLVNSYNVHDVIENLKKVDLTNICSFIVYVNKKGSFNQLNGLELVVDVETGDSKKEPKRMLLGNFLLKNIPLETWENFFDEQLAAQAKDPNNDKNLIDRKSLTAPQLLAKIYCSHANFYGYYIRQIDDNNRDETYAKMLEDLNLFKRFLREYAKHATSFMHYNRIYYNDFELILNNMRNYMRYLTKEQLLRFKDELKEIEALEKSICDMQEESRAAKIK